MFLNEIWERQVITGIYVLPCRYLLGFLTT